jgi:integrase
MKPPPLRAANNRTSRQYPSVLKAGGARDEHRNAGVPRQSPQLCFYSFALLQQLAMREKEWRRLFIQGLPPEDAVRHAGRCTVHSHMLRHSCGYKLANDGHDTRAIQHYLGHRSIASTVRYTALAPDRFKGFWKD